MDLFCVPVTMSVRFWSPYQNLNVLDESLLAFSPAPPLLGCVPKIRYEVARVFTCFGDLNSRPADALLKNCILSWDTPGVRVLT